MPEGNTHPVGGEAPVLLAGTTRAGTTLLSLMLGHHPRIAFVGELEWVWDHPHAPGDLPSYHRWVLTNRHFRNHGLHLDTSLDFDGLVRSFAARMRKLGDPKKKPIYGFQLHRHYDEALDAWPEARVIHIVRDGRDVCASWLKFGWLGNAYKAGVEWRDALDAWERTKARIDPKRVAEVRFEDLIAAPEREVTRLCAHLGTSFDPATLRYHEDTTYEPVDPKQAEKWRKQLSPREIRLFESVAGETLARYGYPPSGQPQQSLPPGASVALNLHNRLSHHRKRLERLGPSLWLADIVGRHVGPSWLESAVQLHINELENAEMK